MLEIVLLGLNHKTAPVEVRECLAFSRDDISAGLRALTQYRSVSEAILFSTCNRVELIMTTEDFDLAVEDAKKFLSETKRIPISDFNDCLYVYRGDEAVRHIFRVGASLDSMMVGEPQILGQIKSAFQTAAAQKTSGVILNRLLHKTFFVAKRVRTETAIGDHAVSISYAAIELARKIFGDLKEKQAMLIGAGEMAELAVEHLMRHQAGCIHVVNRTFERALEMASHFNGKAIRFEEIEDCLQQVDIIISSTGSPNYVITRDQIKKAIRSRRQRPLFFIDIAVPRDIDPGINRLPNCYVYDIDDLKGVVEDNIEDRQKEAIKGETIVDEAVIRFRDWFKSLDVVPTLLQLRNKMDVIAAAETRKTLQSLPHLSEEDQRAIQRMTRALVNKIMHDPTLFLKRSGVRGNKRTYLDIARKLFNIDE